MTKLESNQIKIFEIDPESLSLGTAYFTVLANHVHYFYFSAITVFELFFQRKGFKRMMMNCR